MDYSHAYTSIKLLAFFCLLSCSYTTAAAAPPSPSSALLASATLRARGYSLFATLLHSLSAATNFSGTLLVPPDFAFSSAAAKFLTHPRPPPRPSVALLLYHTIKPPPTLTWASLSSRDDGDQLRTLFADTCLYLFRRPYGGEVSISASPFMNPIAAVRIRQPDIYVDEHLTVHGIDGALDPSYATKCSTSSYADRTAEPVPRRPNRAFLDRAMRALRRTGHNVVATAMAIRRPELLTLTSVTVFAVSDENLFRKSDGFRYDFRHHVVPVRHRFADLANSAAGGTELDTLAPNKTVVVESVNGAVTVNGIAVGAAEVYRNRWIVVVSVKASLDDSPETGAVSGDSSPSAAPFSGDISRVPTPSPNLAPVNFPIDSDDYSPVGTPSPSTVSELDGGDDFPIIVDTGRSPSPTPGIQTPAGFETESPASDDVSDTRCDVNDFVSIGVEGGDLFCPVSTAATVRQLRETGIGDVARSKPSDDSISVAGDDLAQSGEVKIAQKNVNIADDLFFYT